MGGRGLREGERGREREREGEPGKTLEDGGRCPSRLQLLPDT